MLRWTSIREVRRSLTARLGGHLARSIESVGTIAYVSKNCHQVQAEVSV